MNKGKKTRAYLKDSAPLPTPSAGAPLAQARRFGYRRRFNFMRLFMGWWLFSYRRLFMGWCGSSGALANGAPAVGAVPDIFGG